MEASILVCKGMGVPKACMLVGELLETRVNKAQDFMREMLFRQEQSILLTDRLASDGNSGRWDRDTSIHSSETRKVKGSLAMCYPFLM